MVLNLEESVDWYFQEEKAIDSIPYDIPYQNVSILMEEYVIPDTKRLLSYCYAYVVDKAIIILSQGMEYPKSLKCLRKLH